MDRYTKVVLTMIALGLWALFLQNAVWPSMAQKNPPLQRVALCDVAGWNCVKVFGRQNPDMEGALSTHEEH
jgi:hypothetical protein